jgi:hypothetical protein
VSVAGLATTNAISPTAAEVEAVISIIQPTAVGIILVTRAPTAVAAEAVIVDVAGMDMDLPEEGEDTVAVVDTRVEVTETVVETTGRETIAVGMIATQSSFAQKISSVVDAIAPTHLAQMTCTTLIRLGIIIERTSLW